MSVGMPDGYRGHDWRVEDEPRTGGQRVGVARRRYRCETCGVVTDYTRESMVRFLLGQAPCAGRTKQD